MNRRQEILLAAERLLASEGLSGITTRRIAEETGCSEGALYVHFKSRLQLLLAMLDESLPEMLGPLEALQERVGKGSPHKNLQLALRGIFKFHQQITPRLAGVFADPELHEAFRASLSRQNKGPHLSMKALEEYISAEQSLRRIGPQVEPRLAAHLLMSASFFRAFSEQFFGKHMQPAWPAQAKQMVAFLIPVGEKP